MKFWFAVAGIILGVLALLTVSIGVATPVVFSGLGVVSTSIAHLVP
jgi:hypothetical protein